MYGTLPNIDLAPDSDGIIISIPGFPVFIQNSPTGPKTAVLRLPTNTDLLTYYSPRKLPTSVSSSRDMAVRESALDDLDSKARRVLFTSLRLDNNGPDFDDAEVQYAINVILSADIGPSTRAGQIFTVTIRTLFGATFHDLRIPYESEKQKYAREIIALGASASSEKPSAWVGFYDQLYKNCDGYTNEFCINTADIPVHHKRLAVLSLLNEIQKLDPQLDPNS